MHRTCFHPLLPLRLLSGTRYCRTSSGARATPSSLCSTCSDDVAAHMTSKILLELMGTYFVPRNCAPPVMPINRLGMKRIDLLVQNSCRHSRT
jgi:hypothetical protein